MRGVILAGGTGSRLYPTTVSTNKHLLPIYDKPLVYYPLSTLLMAGVRDIIIVSDSTQLEHFRRLFGSGNDLGISIQYVSQLYSNGIVGALMSASESIGDDAALVILGDNIYFGGGFGTTLLQLPTNGEAQIWTKRVSNPHDYGILNFDESLTPKSIIEKPKNPESNMAITGLYYLPKYFTKELQKVIPSERHELEITSLLSIYLSQGRLKVEALHRGTAWFDAGSPDRVFMASDYVRIIQERTGQIVGSPEEVAYRSGLLSFDLFKSAVQNMPESQYKNSLNEISD
jgi:glucose-1-phosphate thymidylyltransferase